MKFVERGVSKLRDRGIIWGEGGRKTFVAKSLQFNQSIKLKCYQTSLT